MKDRSGWGGAGGRHLRPNQLDPSHTHTFWGFVRTQPSNIVVVLITLKLKRKLNKIIKRKHNNDDDANNNGGWIARMSALIN